MPHPDLKKPSFTLVGVDGNAFAVLGAVARALRREGNDDVVINQYLEEAKSGDYDHLLQVSLEHIQDPIYDEEENTYLEE